MNAGSKLVQPSMQRSVLDRGTERALLRRIGLRRVRVAKLDIRRLSRGKGFVFLDSGGKRIADRSVVRRLESLAVPPAYKDVLYAQDPRAHIQAVGRDAAGRLQYRYHPEWEKVREQRKAQRMAMLLAAWPRIRRALSRRLARPCSGREFALAAVAELIARSAIRPGSEAYARLHGSRGATTLLKSNMVVRRDVVSLTFRGKGGKIVQRDVRCARLAAALTRLKSIPGRRLFQYRDGDDVVRTVRRRDVNAFLREVAGVEISLKDFRTLIATQTVADALARTTPARSERLRRRQVLDAVRAVAEELANTPTVCRKSYVHEALTSAFETGALHKLATVRRGAGRPASGRHLLPDIVANHLD